MSYGFAYPDVDLEFHCDRITEFRGLPKYQIYQQFPLVYYHTLNVDDISTIVQSFLTPLQLLALFVFAFGSIVSAVVPVARTTTRGDSF